MLNKNGKLVVFDQDVDAQQNVPDDKRIIFVPQNFRHLQRFQAQMQLKTACFISHSTGI
jgi:ABC-type multidrug transport system ATPase subunit